MNSTAKPIAVAAAVLSVGWVALAGGEKSPTGEDQTAALKATPVTELGAKVVALVREAPEASREQVLRDTVRSAVTLKPAATTLVVSAVSQATPQFAAVAAGTAAGEHPKQAAAIVQAAVQKAPEKVEAIVSAVTKQAPKQYRAIALTADLMAPRSHPQILTGLSDGVPTLAPMISRAQTSLSSAGYTATVPQTLAQVSYWTEAVARESRVPASQLIAENDSRLTQFVPPPGPPVIGPPYQPIGVPTAPFTIPTGTVPPGGRTYCGP